MSSYNYPNVNITTNIKSRNIVRTIENDRTTMFLPIVADKGPYERLTRISTISEYISVFGEVNENIMGQAARNIRNWLSNGTLYTYRLKKSDSSEEASAKVTINAKVGANNNDITLEFELLETGNIQNRKIRLLRYDYTNYAGTKKNLLRIETYEINNGRSTILERISINETETNSEISLEDVLANSLKDSKQFRFTATVEEGSESSKFPEIFTNFQDNSKNIFETEYVFSGGDSASPSIYTEYEEAIKTFFTGDSCKFLLNENISNVEFIMDAGFSFAVKEAMKNFIIQRSNISRGDIILVLDQFEYCDNGDIELNTNADFSDFFDQENGNIVIYTGYYTKKENGSEVKRVPTDRLSYLIPYNDITYGIQFPVAGQKRGTIPEVISLDEDLTPDDKEQYFRDRINYMERDSRGTYFMSQRTRDRLFDYGTESAISFFNNVRVIARIKKDVKRMSKKYLFDINDDETIGALENELQTYINGWVDGRILDMGEVSVAQGESREKLDIAIDLKFNGTIEVISITLNID